MDTTNEIFRHFEDGKRFAARFLVMQIMTETVPHAILMDATLTGGSTDHGTQTTQVLKKEIWSTIIGEF